MTHENDTGLAVEQANAVYDVLVREFGVRDDGHGRASFVRHQTDGFCSEYRVGGTGGFGGKFRRNTGLRTDGTWGEVWYVDAYPEHTTPQVQASIDATNAALAEVRAEA